MHFIRYMIAIAALLPFLGRPTQVVDAFRVAEQQPIVVLEQIDEAVAGNLSRKAMTLMLGSHFASLLLLLLLLRVRIMLNPQRLPQLCRSLLGDRVLPLITSSSRGVHSEAVFTPQLARVVVSFTLRLGRGLHPSRRTSSSTRRPTALLPLPWHAPHALAASRSSIALHIVEVYPELRERVEIAVWMAVDEVIDVGGVVVARPLPTRIAARHVGVVRCVSRRNEGEVERLADHLREQALLKIDVIASGVCANADFARAV